MEENDRFEKIAAGFEALLELQRGFQESHGFDFWKEGPEKRREMFIRSLFALISELAETGDEVNKWWKKGCREPESLEKKRDELLGELIDALHFYLTSLIILNASGEDIAREYLRKLDVNFKRQQDKKLGYV